MNLTEAIKPYQFENGIVDLNPNPSDYEDNLHLTTVVYLWLSGKVANTPEDYDAETDGKYADFRGDCEIRPGIYRRSPRNCERIISHDEYIAIAKSDRQAAKRIVETGKKTSWCFENRHDDEVNYASFFALFCGLPLILLCFLYAYHYRNVAVAVVSTVHFLIVANAVKGLYKHLLRAWHGKALSAIPFYKVRAGEKLNFLDKLLWAFDAITTTFQASGHTSGRQLLLVMADDMQAEGSWILRKAVKIFKNDLKERYGDVHGFFKIYYKEHHPLTQYSKGVQF
jgi:hypothetical protein